MFEIYELSTIYYNINLVLYGLGIKYRNVYHNMIENHFKRLFPFLKLKNYTKEYKTIFSTPRNSGLRY